eukprot:2648529-Amphidinium_carterae.1
MCWAAYGGDRAKACVGGLSFVPILLESFLDAAQVAAQPLSPFKPQLVTTCRFEALVYLHTCRLTPSRAMPMATLTDEFVHIFKFSTLQPWWL